MHAALVEELSRRPEEKQEPSPLPPDLNVHDLSYLRPVREIFV